MSNLIKNEFIKILKKKSTYIIFILTLAFIIFSNIMYKNTDTQMYGNGYSENMLSFYEEDLKNLDPKDPSTLSSYIEIKSQVDMLKLIQKYGFSSWQANIIPDLIPTYIHTINEYEYSSTKDEKAYKHAKLEYDKLVQKLDTNDWQYFASSKLDEINSQIAIQKELQSNTLDKIELSSIENTLSHLEIEKQVLNWRLEKNISFENSFLNSCLETYNNHSELVYSYEHSDNHSYTEKQDYYGSLEKIHISKYYIENGITNIDANDNRGILLSLLDNYELFILIFIIMIAGSIVSDEFSKGTIKLLLVRPYSRAKILISKFIVCIITLLLFIAIVAGAQFILGGLIQGFDSLAVPAVVYNHNTNQIETMGILPYIAISTLAKLPVYILLMTLAFACSTIFTNTAVSIVLPLLGYMASSIINQLALAYDIKAILYFVTPNWDFTQYLFGNLPMFESLNIAFSITICLIYFLIMLLTTLIVFKKRNIKNI